MLTDFSSPKKPRRPPNGYNLFLRRHGNKAKERDRVWEKYSKTRHSNMKVNKLARIATTADIAGLWGGDSKVRERFEREAKGLQELYRAQNETWRAADRFIPYLNYLMNSPNGEELPVASPSKKNTKASMAAAAAARASAAAAIPMVVSSHPSGSIPILTKRRPAAEIIFMLL